MKGLITNIIRKSVSGVVPLSTAQNIKKKAGKYATYASTGKSGLGLAEKAGSWVKSGAEKAGFYGLANMASRKEHSFSKKKNKVELVESVLRKVEQEAQRIIDNKTIQDHWKLIYKNPEIFDGKLTGKEQEGFFALRRKNSLDRLNDKFSSYFPKAETFEDWDKVEEFDKSTPKLTNHSAIMDLALEIAMEEQLAVVEVPVNKW